MPALLCVDLYVHFFDRFSVSIWSFLSKYFKICKLTAIMFIFWEAPKAEICVVTSVNLILNIFFVLFQQKQARHDNIGYKRLQEKFQHSNTHIALYPYNKYLLSLIYKIIKTFWKLLSGFHNYNTSTRSNHRSSLSLIILKSQSILISFKFLS